MKYAFVFPGQGSQYIGMGKDLAVNFKAAKDVFDEVDDVLKQNLFSLMTEGSLSELTLTSNAQPAIMACSMAVIRVLEKEFNLSLKNKVSYFAGHSLGEYSAACAAGVFTLADTAHLLRMRGMAMQKAVPEETGAMAAVLGMCLDDVLPLIEASKQKNETLVVANDNSSGQIVLSGHLSSVEQAIELSGEFGAKLAVKLAVSAPFHSPLMKPAQKTMQECLFKVQANDAELPLISNVTALPEKSKDKILHNLVKQITSTVRWRESIAYLYEQSITDIVEIGPGNVLSNMIKREYKDINTFSVDNTDTLKELTENL